MRSPLTGNHKLTLLHEHREYCAWLSKINKLGTNQLNSGVNCRESVVKRDEFQDKPRRLNWLRSLRVRV